MLLFLHELPNNQPCADWMCVTKPDDVYGITYTLTLYGGSYTNLIYALSYKDKKASENGDP